MDETLWIEAIATTIVGKAPKFGDGPDDDHNSPSQGTSSVDLFTEDIVQDAAQFFEPSHKTRSGGVNPIASKIADIQSKYGVGN
jgi:hypothetical protein